MKNKKLLVLILGANVEPYPRLVNSVFSTWASVNIPNIEIYSYTGSHEKQEIVGNNINLITPDNDVLGKTFEAYEFALKNLKFDFILRTSPSTFVRLDKVYKHLNNKEPKQYYSGHQLNIKLKPIEAKYFMVPEVIYPSGIAMIFSRDILEKIVENKPIIEDKGFGDDFHIGLYLQNAKTYMTEHLPHLPLTDYNIQYTKNISKDTLEKYMFFRCKTVEKDLLPILTITHQTNKNIRNDDEKIRYLFEQFYSEHDYNNYFLEK